MSEATFLVGDVFQRMAELPDHSFDLIVTSPPFLALRSYLPDGHPDKALEIGSEATPADFLDTMLALTVEWRRLLAPHGSIAIEIGDTYAGSGGAGGDYGPDGLREGQARFSQKANKYGDRGRAERGNGPNGGGAYDTFKGGGPGGSGWPLDKSLCGIPTLYTWSLAYGRNLLTGEPSPAGQWRIRNLKPWIRSNPPVGALGDKERPATSYITVATLARDRWFDLDAVRTAPSPTTNRRTAKGVDVRANDTPSGQRDGNWSTLPISDETNPAGAPPLDWVHTIDLILDTELNNRAGKASRREWIGDKRRETMQGGDLGPYDGGAVGARGVHLRRALQAAGVIPPHPDALDISPRGYAGAHYAVWPPELVRLLIDEMCPRRVCTQCGEPSRRIVGDVTYVNTRDGQPARLKPERWRNGGELRDKPGGEQVNQSGATGHDQNATRLAPTLGWSSCGHDAWRPGRILDPFVGSGTTLAVATGMARTAVGIDLDPRNADLARERVGMFLTIHERPVPDAV